VPNQHSARHFNSEKFRAQKVYTATNRRLTLRRPALNESENDDEPSCKKRSQYRSLPALCHNDIGHIVVAMEKTLHQDTKLRIVKAEPVYFV
jgi:hypothetical protein